MNRSFGCVIQRSGGGEFTQPSVHLFAHPLYSEGIFLEEYEKDYIKIFVFRSLTDLRKMATVERGLVKRMKISA